MHMQGINSQLGAIANIDRVNCPVTPDEIHSTIIPY